MIKRAATRGIVAVLATAVAISGFGPATAGAQDAPQASEHRQDGFHRADGLHRPLPITYQAGHAASTTADGPTIEEAAADSEVDGSGGAEPGQGYALATTSDEFVFTFDDTFTDAERAAIVAAGEKWADVLVIDVPIDVRVYEMDLGEGALAGAGPWQYYFPEGSDTLWPAAVVNQLAGDDFNGGPGLDGEGADIGYEIGMIVDDSDIFYDGLDSAVPQGRYSLLTVAMHELAHGLGHTTFAWPDEDTGQLSVRDSGFRYVYDTFVRSADRNITTLGSTALQNALVGPLRWAGVDGTRLNGGTRPALFAPNPFQPGSSVSHLSPTFGRLLSPGINDGVAILSIESVTRGMLADIGWIMENKSGQQAFVAALSNDFLDRPASPGEIDYYVSLLRSGYTRSDIISAYAFSDEWVGVIVDGFYLSTLGRLPDSGGRQYWIDRIKAGMTPAAVGAAFYASAEYFQRAGGTNKLWIESLYKEILGRKADSGGVSFWVGRLNSGTSRQVVAYDFYQSIESRRKRVTGLYRDLLQRKPDAGGLEYWAGILKNGRDVDLAIFLASSTEYYKLSSSRF